MCMVIQVWIHTKSNIFARLCEPYYLDVKLTKTFGSNSSLLSANTRVLSVVGQAEEGNWSADC